MGIFLKYYTNEEKYKLRLKYGMTNIIYRQCIQFLGVFEHIDVNVLKRFAKSIGIVVSKVNNEGEKDQKVKNNLKKWLLQSLDNNKILNQNETIVFKRVLQNDQIEIFSNPRREILVDDVQKKQMLEMMEKLTYIKNGDAQIRVRIDRSHIPRLNAYIVDNYEKFEKNIQRSLEKQMSAYIDDVTKKSLKLKNKEILSLLLSFLSENGTRKNDFGMFMNSLSDEFLSSKDKNLVYEEKRVLDYFVNLLPDEFRKGFSNERAWFSVNLVSKLNDQINNKLYKYILDQNQLFENEYQIFLDKHVNAYINGLVIIYLLSDQGIIFLHILKNQVRGEYQKNKTYQIYLKNRSLYITR